MGVMSKQVSLTCTADDPLYFLFLPWTSLLVFPGFGNTPSLFPTSCGRNPADPEEAALSFQSAAPGISAAQRVELGSLMRETHIHSGQWKQMNWVLQTKITNTPVYFSLTATPGWIWISAPMVGCSSGRSHFCHHMLNAQHPPTCCLSHKRLWQGLRTLLGSGEPPPSSPILLLASGTSTTFSLEWSPRRRWCCPNEWLDKQAPFGPGSACWLSGVLCWLVSSCTPQKQPCDKFWRHYPL